MSIYYFNNQKKTNIIKKKNNSQNLRKKQAPEAQGRTSLDGLLARCPSVILQRRVLRTFISPEQQNSRSAGKGLMSQSLSSPPLLGLSCVTEPCAGCANNSQSSVGLSFRDLGRGELGGALEGKELALRGWRAQP